MSQQHIEKDPQNNTFILRKLALEKTFVQRVEIIQQALVSGLPLRKTFGEISTLFPEVEIKNVDQSIPVFYHPVFYKVYFPEPQNLGGIGYFYVMTYFKRNIESVNVYFQSANRNNLDNRSENYSLLSSSKMFEGMGSAFRDYKNSFISVSDPGHFIEGCSSSFYMGSSSCHFSLHIASFLNRVFRSYKINYEQVLLIGSSAGADGALMTGSLLNQKVNILSVNSWLNLLSRNRLTKVLFGTNDKEILIQKYENQLCCFKQYSQLREKSDAVPNIYLLCNIRDKLHQINLKFFNFLIERFSDPDLNNHFIFDSYFGVEGHGRPNKDAFKEKIKIARQSLTMRSY